MNNKKLTAKQWFQSYLDPIQSLDLPQQEKTLVNEPDLQMGEEIAGQGICPDCKKNAEKVFLTDDDEVCVCLSCNIVLPIRD